MFVFGGIVVVSVALASLLAPFVYEGLIRFGRNVGWLANLRELEFERVFSRLVTIFVIGGLWGRLRFIGFRGIRDLGFCARRFAAVELVIGLAIGVASMVVVHAMGFATGALTWEDNQEARFFAAVTLAFLATLVVGFVEEGFFRGFLLKALTFSRVPWSGVLLSSLIFSLAHFVKPEPPNGVAHADALEGFRLLAYVFRRWDWGWNTFPWALNLFLVGLLLSTIVLVRGDLYLAIGIHSGWVWVLQSVSGRVVRCPDIGIVWFGPFADVTKGWLTTIVLLVGWLGVLILKAREK